MYTCKYCGVGVTAGPIFHSKGCPDEIENEVSRLRAENAKATDAYAYVMAQNNRLGAEIAAMKETLRTCSENVYRLAEERGRLRDALKELLGSKPNEPHKEGCECTPCYARGLLKD